MAFAGVERPVPLAALPQTGSLQREWRRHGMMTAHGAEDLRHAVTPFGKRFVEYIVAADREEQNK